MHVGSNFELALHLKPNISHEMKSESRERVKTLLKVLLPFVKLNFDKLLCFGTTELRLHLKSGAMYQK